MNRDRIRALLGNMYRTAHPNVLVVAGDEERGFADLVRVGRIFYLEHPDGADEDGFSQGLYHVPPLF